MKLEKLLELIYKRPNLFFEEKDLTLVRAYISGFLMSKDSLGLIDEKEIEFKQYFSRFVSKELLLDEEVAWDKILAEQENNWDLFFELASRFLSQKNADN